MNIRNAPLIGLLTLVPLLCDAGVAVTGSLSRDYTVEPGRAYEGSIEVHNTGETPQEVKAYLADYFFYADGSVLYGEPGGLPRSNARWITVVPPQAMIPPGESATFRYSIQVPSDGTLKGTYWSVIMIEPSPEDASQPGTADPSKVTIGIRQVLRYGIQVATSFGTTGARQLRFNQVRLVADKEKRLLVVDLENSGERLLRTFLWVELYDSKGGYVGKFDGGGHRLYPGTTARFTLDLVGVQRSTYKAVIVADCGGDDVFGANVNLVLEE
jgi:hypothetical protein